jgi:AraC-like DNA-binding protein
MPVTAAKFAETTERGVSDSVLDDTLRSLRVAGSVLLRNTYSAPWAIDVPAAAELGKLLRLPGAVFPVVFHLVEFGHCELRQGRDAPLILRAGQIAICFSGSSHRIGAGRNAKVRSLASLLDAAADAALCRGAPAETAAVLCGAFVLHHARFNPLVAALPLVLQADLSRPGELHNLSGFARLLVEEIGRCGAGGYVAERLLEILCAQAVRTYLDGMPARGANWLCGLKDAVVAKAMAAIHADPGQPWSVQRLAAGVSMSPSRFAARFSESTGFAPMNYVARWRMHIACRDLAIPGLGVERIATDLGYESVPAFSRAFKKLVGVSPAAWRTRERASMARQ